MGMVSPDFPRINGGNVVRRSLDGDRNQRCPRLAIDMAQAARSNAPTTTIRHPTVKSVAAVIRTPPLRGSPIGTRPHDFQTNTINIFNSLHYIAAKALFLAYETVQRLDHV